MKQEQQRMPKVRATTHEIGIKKPILQQAGPGNYLFSKIVPVLVGDNRKKTLEVDTDFQENLTAHLIAMCVSVMTHEAYLPIFPDATDGQASIFDVGFMNASSIGAEVQVVCTASGPNPVPAEKIDDLIWNRIQVKHKKPYSLPLNAHLAVLCVQGEYSVDFELLRNRLRSENKFDSYWLIMPYGKPGPCTFIVSYLWGSKFEDWYQYIFDFTPPSGIIAFNQFGKFVQTGKLIPLVGFLRSEVDKNHLKTISP